MKNSSIGFITYDLQEWVTDCLSRIASAVNIPIKAYPVFSRVASDKVTFPYRPSTLNGKFFGITKTGATPEGLTSSINWGAAYECVRRHKIVVLFGIQGGTALVATLLALIFRRQLISVNETLPPEHEEKRILAIRAIKGWILNRCHLHVVRTPATRETLTRVYGISDSLCIDAPGEAGAKVFQEMLSEVKKGREELRAELGVEDRVAFLFVGTLLRFKGVYTIIDACVDLKEKGAKACVVFYGPEASQAEEPTIQEYLEYAQSKGVAEMVLIKGEAPLRVLASAYKAADVVVLPTARDMWPKVLIEGALAELPLITTTACGSAGSLVVDGETGIVIEANNANVLAEAMHKLMAFELRHRLGKRAKEVCLQICDQRKEIEGYLTAIGRVQERVAVKLKQTT